MLLQLTTLKFLYTMLIPLPTNNILYAISNLYLTTVTSWSDQTILKIKPTPMDSQLRRGKPQHSALLTLPNKTFIPFIHNTYFHTIERNIFLKNSHYLLLRLLIWMITLNLERADGESIVPDKQISF